MDIICQVTTKCAIVRKPKLFHHLNTLQVTKAPCQVRSSRCALFRAVHTSTLFGSVRQEWLGLVARLVPGPTCQPLLPATSRAGISQQPSQFCSAERGRKCSMFNNSDGNAVVYRSAGARAPKQTAVAAGTETADAGCSDLCRRCEDPGSEGAASV